MRITAEVKAETRQRIIDAALNLFLTDGWESTTTRGIATAAGIATGTLFNYFESKEAIAAFLVSESLSNSKQELRKRQQDDQSMEEELFSLVWAELRSLRRFRKFLSAAAETIFSPLRRGSADSPGESIRLNHLEAVQQILVRHDIPSTLPPVTMQLYWALYLGVFAYWVSDESPKQEDTLALLDHSLKLFIASLNMGPNEGKSHERQSKGTHRGTSAGSKRKRRG